MMNMDKASIAAPLPDTLLRLPRVIEMAGISRSEIYRRMETHRFPRPVQIGTQSVGWRQSEIQQWIATLPARGTPAPPVRRKPGASAGTTGRAR
jgi:prophage regulatory protein